MTKEKLQKLWTPTWITSLVRPLFQKTSAAPPCKTHGFFVSLAAHFKSRSRTPSPPCNRKNGQRQNDLRRQLQLFDQGRLGNAKAAQWEVEMEHPTAGGPLPTGIEVNTSDVDFAPVWLAARPATAMACCTSLISLRVPLRDPHLLFIFLFEVQSSQSRNGATGGRNPNLTGFPGSWYPRIYRQTSQLAGFQD